MADPLKVTFHNIKADGYETRHADGALGGWTTQGLLFIAFYVERNPIPQATHVEIDPETREFKETGAEGRVGIVRETHSGVVLSAKAAAELQIWLSKLLANKPK